MRYLVDRLRYDSYAAWHYMYMAKVVEILESTYFIKVVGIMEWNIVMDEEMATMVHGIWHPCIIGIRGYTR